MRSTLERSVVWLMLAFYWLNIKAPALVLLLAIDLGVLTVKHAKAAWRELRTEISTTREIADL